MQEFENLVRNFDQYSLSYKWGEPLAKYTTMGIGGPAGLFVNADERNVLELVVHLATSCGIPYCVIGNGSNLIVSDDGYEGLVILNRCKSWKIVETASPLERSNPPASRFNPVDDVNQGLENLNYNDDDTPLKIVRIDSGFKVNSLIKEMFSQGLTGLQWFAGIPSSVGGAVYMNVHGGHKYFGDLVVRAQLTDGRTTKIVDNEYFHFDYDRSVLHQTKEIVLWVEVLLKTGDVEQARSLAKNWAKTKSNQPRRSAGCIFKNLSEETRRNLNLPTSSIGYVIDKMLSLKGMRKGGAVISERHAAFIENTGNAHSAEVYDLINIIKEKARQQLGIEIETEIEFLGKF